MQADLDKFKELSLMLNENFDDLIIFLNENLEVVYVNENAFLKDLGYSEEDLMNKVIFKFIDLDDIKRAEEFYKDIFRFGKSAEELRFKMKSGNTVWYEIKGYKSNSNHQENIILISRNISKFKKTEENLLIKNEYQKKIEKKLKESEENYRLITENVNDLICLLDNKVRYEYINEKAHLEILGYKKEELLGKSIVSYVHPDDREIGIKMLREGRKTGNEKGIFRVKHKDGHYLWVEVKGKLFVNKDNKTKVIMISRDMTERKKSEEKLKKSEEKYRFISENANDLIFILDREGKFLYANESYKRLLGYTPEELFVKSAIELSHPEDRKQTILDFQKALKRNEETNIARYRCKDRSYKWIETRATVTSDNEIDNVKIIGVSRDITERKRIEEKLKKSEEQLKFLNKELEQKVEERTKELRESERKLREQNIELKKIDEIKNDFITMATHELKTPLISISGYTEYIQTKHKESLDELNPEINNDLQVVQKNIARLQKLMDQLLDVMKIESHKIELNKERVNVNNIIQNCIEELSYLYKNHELILDIEDGIILNVDSERIFEIFSNLLSNAVKFTPNNGKIKISGYRKDERYYLFSVKDSGIGLNPEELGNLFKKFELVREYSGENYMKGTGLGLYISNGFVEAHGGKIWATSDGHNKGTTFSFTIPY